MIVYTNQRNNKRHHSFGKDITWVELIRLLDAAEDDTIVSRWGRVTHTYKVRGQTLVEQPKVSTLPPWTGPVVPAYQPRNRRKK